MKKNIDFSSIQYRFSFKCINNKHLVTWKVTKCLLFIHLKENCMRVCFHCNQISYLIAF